MRVKDTNLTIVSILSYSKDVVMALNGFSDRSIDAIVLDILNQSLKFKSISLCFHSYSYKA